MTTLILHHLEPCWDSALRNFHTSFEREEEKAYEWILENKPDRVIVTRFEDYKLCDSYNYLHTVVDDVYEYAYGWEEKHPGEKWCEGGNHSKYVLLPKWLSAIRGKIFLGGAFDGECLEDMEIALTHLKKKYTRVPELIV